MISKIPSSHQKLTPITMETLPLTMEVQISRFLEFSDSANFFYSYNRPSEDIKRLRTEIKKKYEGEIRSTLTAMVDSVLSNNSDSVVWFNERTDVHGDLFKGDLRSSNCHFSRIRVTTNLRKLRVALEKTKEILDEISINPGNLKHRVLIKYLAEADMKLIFNQAPPLLEKNISTAQLLLVSLFNRSTIHDAVEEVTNSEYQSNLNSLLRNLGCSSYNNQPTSGAFTEQEIQLAHFLVKIIFPPTPHESTL